jgi:hypothetical protein
MQVIGSKKCVVLDEAEAAAASGHTDSGRGCSSEVEEGGEGLL